MKKTHTQTYKHTEEQELTELRLKNLDYLKNLLYHFLDFSLDQKSFSLSHFRDRSLLIFQLNLLYQQIKNQVRHACQKYRRSTVCNNKCVSNKYASNNII